MNAQLVENLVQAAQEHQAQEQEANAEPNSVEEYKVWKENSKYLYDLLVTHVLNWPSLTCQWLPDRVASTLPNISEHNALFGTQTSAQDEDDETVQETNYLLVARVQLPTATDAGPAKGKGKQAASGSTNEPKASIKVIQKIVHKGDVNRARYNPLNPSIVATHGVEGEVYVFNRDTRPAEPETDEFRPDLILRGQTQEGYGLAWSNIQDGLLLSASGDGTVALWDTAATNGQTVLDPIAIFRGHTSGVNDVAFDPNSAERFASVGDDGQLLVWHTNQPEPTLRTTCGQGEINALAWNTFAGGNVLAVGGSDENIRLYDVRALSKPVHTIEAHRSTIVSLVFSPTEPTILASAASDRRVNLWDLSQIGVEQDPGDAEDGAPELLFQHGGHTSSPTEVSFAPNNPWHVLTSDDDNVVQVWRPKQTITDDFEIDPDQLE